MLRLEFFDRFLNFVGQVGVQLTLRLLLFLLEDALQLVGLFVFGGCGLGELIQLRQRLGQVSLQGTTDRERQKETSMAM